MVKQLTQLINAGEKTSNGKKKKKGSSGEDDVGELSFGHIAVDVGDMSNLAVEAYGSVEDWERARRHRCSGDLIAAMGPPTHEELQEPVAWPGLSASVIALNNADLEKLEELTDMKHLHALPVVEAMLTTDEPHLQKKEDCNEPFKDQTEALLMVFARHAAKMSELLVNCHVMSSKLKSLPKNDWSDAVNDLDFLIESSNEKMVEEIVPGLRALIALQEAIAGQPKIDSELYARVVVQGGTWTGRLYDSSAAGLVCMLADVAQHVAAGKTVLVVREEGKKDVVKGK